MSQVIKYGQLVNGVVYIMLQLAIAQFMYFAYGAGCFVYVVWLLLFPQRQRWLSLWLCLGFLLGLLIDVFYSSFGVHALASVVLVYSRALLLDRRLLANAYEVLYPITWRHMNSKQLFLFVIPLISIHHTTLFFAEAGYPVSLLTCSLRILLSIFFTMSTVLCVQGLLFLCSKR